MVKVPGLWLVPIQNGLFTTLCTTLTYHYNPIILRYQGFDFYIALIMRAQYRGHL